MVIVETIKRRSEPLCLTALLNFQNKNYEGCSRNSWDVQSLAGMFNYCPSSKYDHISLNHKSNTTSFKVLGSVPGLEFYRKRTKVSFT